MHFFKGSITGLPLPVSAQDAPDQQVSRTSVNELDATSSATIPLRLGSYMTKKYRQIARLTALGSTFQTREPRFAQ